ncbi:MAG: nucleotidyltransferase domain-containing protein [Oscillospiraceae bacterium]|nr:nucleotidyltransferase domain-containing protein [Oscillospiraceae bacterium]
MLDKGKAREIAHKYANTVVKAFTPDKIILFGSHVNGVPHEWSDIDVAVLIDGFDGDWLNISAELYALAWTFDEIIEPHLLDPSHDPSGFVAHVVKTGEIIYQSA